MRSVLTWVLMPTTSFLWFSTGPPEFPIAIGAEWVFGELMIPSVIRSSR